MLEIELTDDVHLATDDVPIDNDLDSYVSVKPKERKRDIKDMQDQGATDKLEFPEVFKDSSTMDTRDRTHTEKGYSYRIDRLRCHHRAAKSSWRKQASKLEGLLTDCEDPNQLRAERDQLNTAMKMIESTFSELQLEGAHEEWMQKMEDIEDRHLELMKQIGERVRFISDGESVYSRKSVRSVRSTHSSILEQKATLAAETASLRVKLTKETEIARIKTILDRLKLEEDLEIAEARLKAVADVQPDYSIPTASNVLIAVPPTDSMAHPPVSNIQTSDNVSAIAPLVDLIKTLTEQTTLSRLPQPEPDIFTGDPVKYPGWTTAFELLIERRNIPVAERLHYMKRYLGGQARESIEGYFLLKSDDAYSKARDFLKERYGNGYTVANTFRDRLEDWPKIKPQDGLSLRKYADFLRQCTVAMETITEL